MDEKGYLYLGVPNRDENKEYLKPPSRQRSMKQPPRFTITSVLHPGKTCPKCDGKTFTPSKTVGTWMIIALIVEWGMLYR